MTAMNEERAAFERETRYIVIKRSDLAKLDQAGLLRPESLDGLVDICGRLPPREYVVVESDWPEFQPTWAAIEARVSGLATTVPAGCKVVAWHTEDHLTDKSATTYDPEIAARWRAKGWPVTPLYTHPAASVPAGCKVVPVELLERLEHVTRTLVPHLQCHVELRALLASAEGVKDE